MLAHSDPAKAVPVVQHHHSPANAVKIDGKVRTTHPRNTLTSFVLFNGARPAMMALTPAVVDGAEPAVLHRFTWVGADSAIGALPLAWTFLAGGYPAPAELPACIHCTNGGPWFDNWQDVLFSDLWPKEKALYEQRKAA